jgi:hypothetical protein
MEIIELVDRIRRHGAAVEQAARQRDVRAELASAMRAWFAGELGRISPGKHQPMDTVLGERVGLPHTAELLSKRSGAMRFYGRTSEVERQRGGTKIRCALNCREASPAKLRKAFKRVHDVQLRQMRNSDLKTAGIVLEADVLADGTVDLLCVVTDPTAALKVSERAYTGCLVSLDGDEISDISLVDSPAGFLEKAGRPGGEVIAKICDGGGSVKDKDWRKAEKMAKRLGGTAAQYFDALKKVKPIMAQALPPAVERALQQRQAAEDAYRERPTDFTKAQFARADAATRVAVIGSQRPAAVGDTGLIGFLRHGRP